MKTLIPAIALALIVTGCARFHTTQSDKRWEDTNGVSRTEIVTKAGSYTLFSSKSQLANFKATQTEKSQGATVGLLTQQGATNVVGALIEINRILSRLAVPGL